MEKFIAIFLISVATTSDVSKSPIEVNMPTVCVNSIALLETTKQYGEYPFVRGTSNRGSIKTTTVLFINPETRTWTMAEQVEKDLFCITGVGDEFEPVPTDVIEEFKEETKENLTNSNKRTILNNKIAV